MSQGLRIIFAGTPEFAAEHLKALLGSRHQVIAVYSQPDRPAGRGKKLSASPVKEVALAHDIPVYQPLNFKSPEAVEALAALNADLMVVVAYGLILPQAVLAAPRLGCINVHASILPRWRGAAPIQRAIEAGDTQTGVTIMQMDVGLDTGDMLIKAYCPILAEDTGGSLHDRLITLGAPALIEALDLIESGAIKPEKQDDSLSNYAPKLSKEEAALNWQLSAVELARKVRAFNPFPVAHTKPAGASDDQRMRVWAARASNTNANAAPGSITQINSEGLWIACKEGQLVLEMLQLPGKKAMSVGEILRGHPDLFSLGQQLEQPVC
ncbi:Fmt methionyl-tRNA formyltransferase [Cellvibrio sp. BR]|uniref:methionyl-tRNA formyltransferase n=1 Tax=Cellvibrio sp. BR TaxID=1134474 RepID=UPI000260152D|nr:methionyl-tRNA formyltransferase [Cellvibrio sp. BR]EIK46226.1 Fmt methionyl-tRNA formyltransferase [Cellvibrio sp. BR]